MPNLQVENIDVQKLKIHDKNPKQHSKKQIGQIAQSIKEFGFYHRYWQMNNSKSLPVMGG